eukprot:TRINITY_DN3847_c0_g3_i2.p2 TRINITY_DN3847_c0_g3~~TRINITY_DN3847_c0_g3_i2.p2  ORF type:complete len:554 (+),score=180.33 TRINITY_DN3847_c0_g3_i2:2572-4233(+)
MERDHSLNLVKGPEDPIFDDVRGVFKYLETYEKPIYCKKLWKFNYKSKKQERTLLITNLNIINVDNLDFLAKTISFLVPSYQVKRKIPLSRVRAMTISKTGPEFIVHVPEEYDYRFSTEDKEEVILHIFAAIIQNEDKKRIGFFFKDDLVLDRYATSKFDIEKAISRMPVEPPQILAFDELKIELEALKASRDKDKLNTETTVARRQGEKVKLDDFLLLKVLGRGAFGKVMLVEKKDTKELFALKSLHKDNIIEKEQIEHTRTERFILEQANNPFLVKLEYAFQTPDKLFFVMKFMRGGELFQHLRQSKRFPEERAKFYAAQITMALEYLHSLDVVYRDLKPENILLDDEGNICITDYGMAKMIPNNGKTYSFVGTAEYLAPEVIQCIGHGKTADWWSLGILIYEMLVGIPPFYHENQDTMFAYIKQAPVRFPTKVTVAPAAQDLITKLLTKKPEQRLGAQEDAKEIKSHPWFADIDWGKMYRKETKPPFKPKISADDDVTNFDQEYTREEVKNTYVGPDKLKEIKGFQKEFSGFTYVPQNNMLNKQGPPPEN